jgi:hypothetical protein
VPFFASSKCSRAASRVILHKTWVRKTASAGPSTCPEEIRRVIAVSIARNRLEGLSHVIGARYYFGVDVSIARYRLEG